eukprot:gb/GECH01004970.1/.p1 GENE.gb/GECH01004970.1/~~gb/GECH01004970.1/.p1  ORF type:complete len:253 (+),score=48.06 gb/GECH01004970.1/:1-759(+)
MSNKVRNRPGTSAQEFNNWDYIPYKEMSGTLAAQQHLQQLIRLNPSDMETICSCPEEIDNMVWLYEHFRQLLYELNDFVLAHNEVCTKETHPVMRMKDPNTNEDTVFLCSGFDPPQEVSAIDYMTNTITNSVALLCSPKNFESRVVIDSKKKKIFKTLARRLYRIFAFSYFVHRSTFMEFEEKTHLCERFTRIAKEYKLMSSSLFWIPSKTFKKTNPKSSEMLEKQERIRERFKQYENMAAGSDETVRIERK